MYTEYPETVTKIITTVPSWGYPKDYMLFLIACKKKQSVARKHNKRLKYYEANIGKQEDEEVLKSKLYQPTSFEYIDVNKYVQLEEFIYNHMYDTMQKDIDKYRKKKRISTLAKWMPREKSSFDKKLHFVDTMCTMLFPKIKNRFRAKTKYRKLLVELSKYLKTTEIKLCEKKPEEINFRRVPYLCFRKNFKAFTKNEKSKKKLKEYLTIKYIKYSLQKLIKYTYNKRQFTQFEKDIINDVYEDNKLLYNQIIKCKLLDISEMDIMIDISKSMFDNGYIYTVIGLSLLCNNNKNKIIINACNPQLLKIQSDKFTDIVEQIKDTCCSYKKIQLEKGLKLLDDNKDLLIISDKVCTCKNDTLVTKRNIFYWQIEYSNIGKIEYVDGINIIKGNISKPSRKNNKREKRLVKLLDNAELFPPRYSLNSIFRITEIILVMLFMYFIIKIIF